MRRRRFREQGTNLDLMLDAICNVFGGIVLVAILVVLQTQTTAGSLRDPSSEEVKMSLEGRKLKAEVSRLQDDIEDLRRQEQAARNALLTVSSPDTQRIVDAKIEFKEAISEASERVEMLQTLRAEALAADAPVSDALVQVERQLGLKKEEAERLKGQLALLASKPRRSVRLPHRRGMAQGICRYYVIQGERAYGCGSGSLPRWNGTPYRLEDCIVTPILDDEAARIQPIDGAGVRVPERNQDIDDFLQTLRHCAPHSHYILFFVCLDNKSYDSFQILKAEVVKKGFAYAVCPKTDMMPGITVTPTLGHETE